MAPDAFRDLLDQFLVVETSFLKQFSRLDSPVFRMAELAFGMQLLRASDIMEESPQFDDAQIGLLFLLGDNSGIMQDS